jgi:hypothetical protein
MITVDRNEDGVVFTDTLTETELPVTLKQARDLILSIKRGGLDGHPYGRLT